MVNQIKQEVTTKQEFNSRIDHYLSSNYKLISQTENQAIIEQKIKWFRLGFWFLFGSITFVFIVGGLLILIGIIDILYQKSKQEHITLILNEKINNNSIDDDAINKDVVYTDTKFCIECGNKIDVTSSFCSNCGAKTQ